MSFIRTNPKEWFTTSDAGGIKTIKKGGSPRSFIVDVSKHKFVGDETDGKIVHESEDGTDVSQAPAPLLLGSVFGLYYISLFTGIEIHKFPIEFEELRSGNHTPTGMDEDVVYRGEDYRLVHRKEMVDTLYWRHTYPFPVLEAETADGIPVNLVVNVTTQVINPYPAMYVWEGKHLRGINNAVRSAILDFVFKRNYKEEKIKRPKDENGKSQRIVIPPLLGIDKQMYDQDKNDPDSNKLSDFAETIDRLNHAKELHDGDETSDGGIVGLYGLKIIRVEIVDIALGEEHRAVEKAIYAKELKKQEALGKIEEGKGEGGYLEEIGKGRAAALQAVMKVADQHRGGAEVVVSENVRDGIEGFKGKFLTLGSGGPNQGAPIPAVQIDSIDDDVPEGKTKRIKDALKKSSEEESSSKS